MSLFWIAYAARACQSESGACGIGGAAYSAWRGLRGWDVSGWIGEWTGGRTLVGVAGGHADVARVAGLDDVVEGLHLRGVQSVSICGVVGRRARRTVSSMGVV